MTNPRDPEPSAADRGSATIWACAWIGLLLTIGCIASCAAVAVAAQHHLDAAADLSAISAASRLQRGGDPCAAARSVAVQNEATLANCHVVGDDVLVSVRTRLELPFNISVPIGSQARAGP